MRKVLILIILGMVVLPLLAITSWQSDPKSYLDTFMRVRGDKSGKDVVFHWTGSVYSFIPGEKRMHLFDFEGFNIAKTVVGESGFELYTREAAFYKDPGSGQILETWRNPLTSREVPVVQIWNDPVNQDLNFEPDYLPYISKILPSADLGDQVCFYMDIFPFYPSPMPRKDFAEFSQADLYQAGEFFQFYVDKEDIENKELSTIPASISWSRISPWMPFMRMGDRAGNLVFVCRGRKLPNGYSDLPQTIRDYVEAKNPQYSQAPGEYSEPNETSWTYFKKLLEQGLIK